MTMSTSSPARPGSFIRRLNPCGHRTGQWAQILTTSTAHDQEHFLVIYHDSETELLPAESLGHHYEFGPAPAQWNSRIDTRGKG
ncbi:hypothetical protein [Rhodococcus koreensis]|uniref:Uncharacterized protein n=1 Tax=Rhodococcus koreensis TaxID=99653 RepID=A0A1H4RHP0_9NOCA|nr:hypothetical protein [Rhodococcus koreensis]SEC31422.1 hypothetical protein SAMN04490239_3641 [Rhodococcus koreensis]